MEISTVSHCVSSRALEECEEVMEDSEEISTPTRLKRQQKDALDPDLRVVASLPKEEKPVKVKGDITVSF